MNDETYLLLEKSLDHSLTLSQQKQLLKLIPWLSDKSDLLLLYREIAPVILSWCQFHQASLTSKIVLTNLWLLWLPLALQISRKPCPYIQGILGIQGTGKTTLTKILTIILAKLGINSINLSLDDLYKTYDERQALKMEDPRFIWRGPPGTHDIQLGEDILSAFKNQQYPLNIPRFDKSAYGGLGDRAYFETINQADIILFEGWFVGTGPINPTLFDNPPPPINTLADQSWALYMNQKLNEYLNLWKLIDGLIILKPTDFRYSKIWRKQAEVDMKTSTKTGMTDEQIEDFVNYFWISLHPELYIPPLLSQAELIIEIDYDHQIKTILYNDHFNL